MPGTMLPLLCLLFLLGIYGGGGGGGALVVVAASIETGTTIRASQQQFWNSSSNTFSFGFHPITDFPGLFALGISANPSSNINDSMLVWTAGDDGGFKMGRNAVLEFGKDGNLVLRNSSSSSNAAVTWQSNSSSSSVVIAELRSDGNLLLRNSTDTNSSINIVWQSFDNPAEALLVNQILRSGQGLKRGLYHMRLQPSSGNLTLQRGNITYWSAPGKPGFTAQLSSDGTFQLRNSSAAVLWSARSDDYTNQGVTFRHVRLDSDGNLRTYGWTSSSSQWSAEWSAVLDPCLVFGLCGNYGICSLNASGPVCSCPSQDFEFIDPNHPSNGCRLTRNLTGCGNAVSTIVLNHTRFFSYPPEDTSGDVFSKGMEECQSHCLTSPVCVASTVMADGSGTCLVKSETFVSAHQSPELGSASFVKVCGQGRPYSPPPPPRREMNGNSQTLSKGALAGISVGVLVGVLVLLHVLVWFYCCRGLRKQNFYGFRRVPEQYTLLEYASGAPVRFSFREIEEVTANFREKLGEGASGSVYKGQLSNGLAVAVKRLEHHELQQRGEKQFSMEVAAISSTHHLNLVRLIGFCLEARHRVLVYEFMKNSSLDKFLFAGAGQPSKFLDWETRFRIALGTAKAIAYLHEECRSCIVHCDIKPENVLLDEYFVPKVSDFGLSKVVRHAKMKLSLASVHGTRGYLAPEWLSNQPITSKSDVYSYGMVLLEIISGRRSFEWLEQEKVRYSVWAYRQLQLGNVEAIIDERLGREYDSEQVTRLAHISFLCAQAQASQRPTMGKVVQMVEGVMAFDAIPVSETSGTTTSSINYGVSRHNSS